MKTTRIKIKNLFGISEKELDGQSIELRGTNGTGKTSVIDAIKYALTNSSERDYIIKNGENEGEIIVETDTGLRINRKKRSGQADYKSIKENGREVSAPESFLSQLFTPLQLDPVAFTLMDKKEQNRRILDLIEFPWDLNWIKEQFGEIPSWINYEQNILQVLFDIQDKNYCVITVATEGEVTITAYTYNDNQTFKTLRNADVVSGTAENEIEVTDATLVSASNIDDVASRVLAHYIKNKTLECDIVINGEMCGDKVNLQTEWSGIQTGRIEQLEYDLGRKKIGKVVQRIG